MNGIKWVDTFPEARDRRDATAYPAGPGGGYLRVYEHPGSVHFQSGIGKPMDLSSILHIASPKFWSQGHWTT
jgi:hypothetical protein